MEQSNDKFRLLRQTVEKFSRLRTPSILILRKAPQGISNQEGRLGIFPASFNPPTRAHAALVREAKKQADLDEILVLLDLQAMDKRPTGASWEERSAMLKLLFRRDPKISIGLSNRGLFTEKIKPLRQIYPASAEFTFIVGFDTILRVIDKKYYRNRKKSLDQLFDRCRFFVANRNYYEESAFEIVFRRRELREYRKKIAFFTLPRRFSSHSSSSVRKLIAEGQPINDRVPESIFRFIKKKSLYIQSKT